VVRTSSPWPVACTPRHRPNVYACHRGNGLYGQLGHSSETSSAAPLLVHACEGLRVIYVACGAYHTAAIIGTVMCIGMSIRSRTQLTVTRSLSSACAQRAVTC
jgi:alpha-tubulin suppressor-like RCC1 family protein